jgi:tetratricopeptide (TPR) repeat protein
MSLAFTENSAQRRKPMMQRFDDVSVEETNKAWNATLEGNYAEAIPQYQSILARRLKLGEMNNYATTLMLAGKLEEAEATLRDIRHIPTPMFTQVVHPKLGVVLWLQGKHEEACQDWANEFERIRNRQVTYYDETGVVPPLLWWASAHSGLEKWRKVAADALKRLWRSERTRRFPWPGSIVGFLLGKITAEQLLEAAVETQYPELHIRRTCIAHFYISAMLLAQGDTEGYRRELELALSIPQKALILHPEYHLARNELSIANKQTDTEEQSDT